MVWYELRDECTYRKKDGDENNKIYWKEIRHIVLTRLWQRTSIFVQFSNISVHASDKLKILAAQISGGFFSLSNGRLTFSFSTF